MARPSAAATAAAAAAAVAAAAAAGHRQRTKGGRTRDTREEHASEHDVRNAASAVGEEHASEHDKDSVIAECGTVPSVLPAEPTTVMVMCTRHQRIQLGSCLPSK